MSVRIKNFRSFEDATINFDDYTCLVGPNGAGKSAVLCALNIFFRETAESPTNLHELGAEDFHHSKTEQPIEIIVTFGDLDQTAQEDFADYYRQGQLVISAVATFNPESKRAPVVQMGERLVMKAFGPFFDADKTKAGVEELKRIYAGLQTKFPELPAAATKPKIAAAIRQYEEHHPDHCELSRSEDQFYGFSKGANRLAKHIQWVFVPAVKDASAEQAESKDTALGQLLARTVRAKVSFDEALRQIRTDAQARYQELLDGQQSALKEISAALRARLTEWAHPDAHVTLQWQHDPAKSVQIAEPFAQILAGEGLFAGNIARFGHGLQRAYLLALLHELSRVPIAGQPKLILAVEEPELYQHPPQCRHLTHVLQDLATSGSQVIVTTHSPYFVSGKMFESVRKVRKDREKSISSVHQVSADVILTRVSSARGETAPRRIEGTLAKIHQALQPNINEIFFTPHLVLCEGREDVAYIVTYLMLMGRTDDLRRAGCHFVAAERKSSMLIPLAILGELAVPTLVVFDSDAHLPDKNGSREQHRKDNAALLHLCGHDQCDPLSSETVWCSNVVMWASDITTAVQSDFDRSALATIKARVEASFGHVGGLEKNPLFVSEVLHAAWQEGMRSANLQRLGETILTHCGV